MRTITIYGVGYIARNQYVPFWLGEPSNGLIDSDSDIDHSRRVVSVRNGDALAPALTYISQTDSTRRRDRQIDEKQHSV